MKFPKDFGVRSNRYFIILFPAFVTPVQHRCVAVRSSVVMLLGCRYYCIGTAFVVGVPSHNRQLYTRNNGESSRHISLYIFKFSRSIYILLLNGASQPKLNQGSTADLQNKILAFAKMIIKKETLCKTSLFSKTIYVST